MLFWRRRKPVHEELAAGTGLLEWQSKYEPAMPGFRTTLDFLHGARPRRWDAVVTATAPHLSGDAVRFLALPDGRLIVDEKVADGSLEPLAAAVAGAITPPYRAEGVRRHDGLWAVAANGIDVLDVPEEIPGERVELSLRNGVRSLTVDGEPSLAPLPTLEAHASEQHDDYVVRAERLEGDAWEVEVSPL